MKILQVNCVFRTGSTGKITDDIHTELKKNNIQSVVCYGRGKRYTETGVYCFGSWVEGKLDAVRSRLTGVMYGGCYYSTAKLISIIRKEKPDVVHLQCINGHIVNIYGFISWLKKHHIRTVLTLHAEFMHTANCAQAIDCEKWKTGCEDCAKVADKKNVLLRNGVSRSWKKMRDAFDGFAELQIVGVSQWIRSRAQESAILGQFNIKCIPNGVLLDKFHPGAEPGERERLYKQYGIPTDKKIVLHVTPSFDDPIKGGKYIEQLVCKLPDDCQMVVVGRGRKQLDHVIRIPFMENQEDLAAIYRAASVFVITSIAENYPTVCLEANCCGTPVVGFDTGGVKETIGENMGEVVPLFDVDSLADRVLYWSERTIDNDLLEERRLYCSKERMTKDYVELYKQLKEDLT